MKGFPTELVYILVFGAVLLFNFVLQKAVRRQKEEAARNAPPEEEIPEEEWNAAQIAAVRRPEPAPVLAHRLPDPPPVPSRRRVARQSLFGARWDMQEAVVVATILGRCRADEPHEVR